MIRKINENRKPESTKKAQFNCPSCGQRLEMNEGKETCPACNAILESRIRGTHLELQVTNEACGCKGKKKKKKVNEGSRNSIDFKYISTHNANDAAEYLHGLGLDSDYIESHRSEVKDELEEFIDIPGGYYGREFDLDDVVDDIVKEMRKTE